MSALGSWLATREPAAPLALQARLAQLVAEHDEWNAMPIPDALLAAGELLLQNVLAAPPKDRDTALDLLAADACVTYAFEAAADSPERMIRLAEGAMARVAELSGKAI